MFNNSFISLGNILFWFSVKDKENDILPQVIKWFAHTSSRDPARNKRVLSAVTLNQLGRSSPTSGEGRNTLFFSQLSWLVYSLIEPTTPPLHPLTCRKASGFSRYEIPLSNWLALPHPRYSRPLSLTPTSNPRPSHLGRVSRSTWPIDSESVYESWNRDARAAQEGRTRELETGFRKSH